jgi:hypothetical protein
VRCHRRDGRPHVAHRRGRVQGACRAEKAHPGRRPRLGDKTGGMDDGLRRHTARAQAVATHLVRLDQRDLCTSLGRYQGADQTGASGPDHHQVPVEDARLLPGWAYVGLVNRRVIRRAPTGSKASSSNEPMTAGDRMPDKLWRLPIRVPALT